MNSIAYSASLPPTSHETMSLVSESMPVHVHTSPTTSITFNLARGYPHDVNGPRYRVTRSAFSVGSSHGVLRSPARSRRFSASRRPLPA